MIPLVLILEHFISFVVKEVIVIVAHLNGKVEREEERGGETSAQEVEDVTIQST